ncbi:MAG: hypothetical protein OES38_01205 [Gammaproteobacteria bacterium]|nr:hypothetical protein [Gammaproteobacteria bacterium]
MTITNYNCITPDYITPKLGAEVGGVDVAHLSDAGITEIQATLRDRHPLVFRDLHLHPITHH